MDAYLGYNQIVIAHKNQKMKTLTCPYGTFAYRMVPFGLYNASATFQQCMMFIFSYIVKKFIEIFMEGFSVFEHSFDACSPNPSLVLKGVKRLT